MVIDGNFSSYFNNNTCPGLSNVFYEDGIILASPNVYVSFFCGVGETTS